MRTSTLFALTLTFVLTGCATLTPVHQVAETPGAARVVLKERDHDIFKLEVYNTSQAPMVVYRDAITLERPNRIEQRLPGGVASAYFIPPGGRHAVNVKFALDGLHRGDPIWIDFRDAIEVAGQKLEVDPIELRVD